MHTPTPYPILLTISTTTRDQSLSVYVEGKVPHHWTTIRLEKHVGLKQPLRYLFESALSFFFSFCSFFVGHISICMVSLGLELVHAGYSLTKKARAVI